ncbi:MAG: T9SS type A sorting domain-containing protein, partial [Bacteroidales bacterium]|nr:T9SS type A sorting domain-containing protein [Bacteroidales bacterium]
YHVLLPSQTTDIPLLTWQKAVSGSTVMIQQPTSPKDTGIIIVKSANDSVQKIYYVFFDVEISTNAALKSISLNANNITSFHADTVYYHVYLHYDSLTPPVVGAMTQSAAASILISQATTVNDSAVISVTAEDSLYERTYIVHFTRQLSPVATLNSMGYQLDNKDSSLREFNSNVFSYTVHLKVETTHIPHTFIYVKTDARASVQIMRMPLHVNDTAILKVVAENLIDSNVYEIVFKRIPSNNTYLDTLFVNGNSIADFYKDSLHYTVILPWATTQIPTINAVASWNLSTINITQAASYFGLAQIRVVSEDGLHSRTYTVQFEQGSQVDLQSLSYCLDTQTISISTFHPADTVYYVQLPIGTKSIPTLHYTLVDNRCYVDTIPALSPNGEIELIVKGWDELNLKTYKVVFEVILSTNAKLSDLTIDNVSVHGFHPDTLIYYVEYPYGTTDLPTVGAVAMEPDASVSVTQITTYPDVAHVIVKAGDTTVSKIYQIYFSTEAGDNAYLAAMYVDDTLINDFDKNILFYKHELPYGTTTVPVIYAEAEDARAHVEITQAHSLQDTVWVKVTAVNGVNTTTYGLVFRIALNNDARLAWIKVDNTPIATFNPEINNYKYELPFGYQGIPTVTVEKQDKNATATITPTTTIPGQTVIDVVAEDGETVRTYRVNFVISNSIYETQENCQFLVYPNPAHDLVSVENKGDNKHINLIQLYDVFGKLIKQSKVNQSITHIDIKELPNGMYIVKIIQNDQTSSNVKIIKY